MANRVCKQCGNELPETEFRVYPYKSRSATAPRRNTICRECENFNQRVNRAYNANPRTEYQQELVDEAIDVYMYLLSHGLEPIGALANSLSGKTSRPGPRTGVKDYRAHVMPEVTFNELLESERAAGFEIEIVDEEDE